MPSTLDLADIYTASFAEAARRGQDDTALATSRQRDGAALDMRMVTGYVAGTLAAATDPVDFANTNAGIRVPLTVDQPGNAVPPGQVGSGVKTS